MSNAFGDKGFGDLYSGSVNPTDYGNPAMGNGVPNNVGDSYADGSFPTSDGSIPPVASGPQMSSTTTAPVNSLANGVGSILLFPGTTIVSQFVGTGDPLDASHLPITVIISAAAWYALWHFFVKEHFNK